MNIFTPKNLKCQFFDVFYTQKMIKNVIFNKTKNTHVGFFIYMSSMCVQLFTAFEVPVLKLYGHHFHGNEPREIFFDFVSIFCHTDHNKYTMK